MTIDEIKKSLPNGFHDSEILQINLDYVDEKAEFLMDVDLSSSDSETEVASQSGYLRLSGLLYCVIDPPTGAFPREFVPGDSRMWLTADSSDFSELSNIPNLPDPLPDNSFRHFFFVSSHNCFIYVAAMNASFEWVD